MLTSTRILELACLAKNSIEQHNGATPWQLMCGSALSASMELTDSCDSGTPGPGSGIQIHPKVYPILLHTWSFGAYHWLNCSECLQSF